MTTAVLAILVSCAVAVLVPIALADASRRPAYRRRRKDAGGGPTTGDVGGGGGGDGGGGGCE